MSALHLVRLGIRKDALMNHARRRHLPLHELDLGYVVHAVLTELWQDQAPAPFRLKEGTGAFAEVWGYTALDKQGLKDHVGLYAPPDTAALVDLEAIESKAMPEVPTGKVVGFELRACPIIRQKLPRKSPSDPERHREVDVWLARCHAVGKDVVVNREEVYREWLASHFERLPGAKLKAVRLAGYEREHVYRRRQAPDTEGHRKGRAFQRPDAHFEGVLEVTDAAGFSQLLARGVGRHRAFGFGMLVLVPPRLPC